MLFLSMHSHVVFPQDDAGRGVTPRMVMMRDLRY